MLAHPQSSSAARNLSLVPSSEPSASTAEAHRSNHGGLPLSEGAGLAHDAGNLLGALSLYCDLLEAPGVLAGPHRHYAAELRLIYERSGALLSRLLHLTPQDAFQPKQTPDLPKIHRFPATGRSAPAHQTPAKTLHTIAPLLSTLAAPYAHVTVEIVPHLPPVQIAPEALERIAVNLVRNAAQAIHASRLGGGHIHVSLSVVGGRLRLSVEDNGPGMSPALAAAFLHPEPLPPGTDRGFGHRNVHELAEATHGRLGIHVRPGRGTSLCLDWDIHHTHLEHAAHHPRPGAPLPPPAPAAAMRLRWPVRQPDLTPQGGQTA